MNNSRRQFLWTIGGGFGGLAATQMLADEALPIEPNSAKQEFNGGLHHPAKARWVVQLFMTGGTSPMDTFDYKPKLEKLHGQNLGRRNRKALRGRLARS